MEHALMGKVLVGAKIENLFDLHSLEMGAIGAEQIRRVEVVNALVDTGATMLSMPKRLIDQLGLRQFRTRKTLTSAGPGEARVYGAVRLTIQDRDCNVDVSEVPDECPVLIGQVPLELLDFVVDPAGQRLIGNPAHGGEHMIEMY
ncbi:MAG TPA: retropepsin-like aspartic protease [Pirellulales bacterium]